MVDEQFSAFETREEILQKISAIDELINLQLNEILHHPEFKALEATWRGLHYLVSETDPDLKVKILMLNIGKKELLKDFERALEFDESQIFKKVFTDNFSNPRGMPFGMLIGAYEFGNHPQDIAWLEYMSQLAAFSHAPFIAAVSPEMFGLESFGEMTEFLEFPEIVNRPEHKRWQNFRESDGSDYVGLCLPHILLREPYKTNKSFDFQETTGKENLLWGNAAFAFGACVARAYKEKSWLGKMRGIDDDGAVEGLCFYMFDAEDEINGKSSLDADLSTKKADQLSVEGFIPLIKMPGTDRTGIFSSHSTQKTEGL